MSYRRPVSNIVQDRLATWYLFKPRSFNITIEQLAEIMEALEKQVIVGYSNGGKNVRRQKVSELLNHLRAINKNKKSPTIIQEG